MIWAQDSYWHFVWTFQCRPSVSWKPDPDAAAIDAFSIPWSGRDCVTCFSLLGGVLQKVVAEKAETIIIVPLWTTQYWFSMLSLLILYCSFLLPGNQLVAHDSHQQPPDNLKPIVCRVSGRSSPALTFGRVPKTSSCCIVICQMSLLGCLPWFQRGTTVYWKDIFWKKTHRHHLGKLQSQYTTYLNK